MKPYILSEDKAKQRMQYYTSKGWKQLSKRFKKYNPLDILDIQEHKATSVEEVHHLVPFFDQDSNIKRYALLVDEDNLIPVSVVNHHKIHQDYYSLTERQREYLEMRIKYVKSKYERLGLQIKCDFKSSKDRFIEDNNVKVIKGEGIKSNSLDVMMKNVGGDLNDQSSMFSGRSEDK